MRVTYTVVVSDVSEGKYWDNANVTREVTVESNEDDVLLAAIPGALEVLSGLAGLAIAEKRIKIQEETDESNTDSDD